MKVVKGLLFVHPSMGLGIVTSLSGDNASVSFEEYPGRSYLITLNYIKTVYSFNMVMSKVSSVKDIIRKDLLDGFFTIANRAKGHSIYQNGDSIYIAEDRNDLIMANVVGTSIYDTSIRFSDGVVSMQCSCPVNGYCKHLFALIDFIKHEKNYSPIKKDSFIDDYPLNSSIEELFNKNISDRYDFSYLDSIKSLIESLINDYSPQDIASFFLHHAEINSTTQFLHHRICYIHNDIYNKLISFIKDNPEFKAHSPFLGSLEKNHEILHDNLSSRYYVSDVLKRRENDLLYYCFNEKYEDALGVISEPSFNYNSKIVIAYFLDKIFDSSYRIYKDYIRNIFKNDFEIIYEIYKRTDNVRLQKNLYLDFYLFFKEMNIKREDIASIDIFGQMMNKKEKLTTKKKIELLELIDKCIKEGNEKEVVSYMFSDWINSRSPFFDEEMREQIFAKISNNSLLLKIASAKRGGYDYY